MSCRRSIRFVKFGKYTTSKSHGVCKTYRTYKGGPCLPKVMLAVGTTMKRRLFNLWRSLEILQGYSFPEWSPMLGCATQ